MFNNSKALWLFFGLVWCVNLLTALPVQSDADWRFYGRDAAGTRFSPLTQINRANVANLRVAWRYRAGGSNTALHTAMECTPLIIRGVMYVTSPDLQVIALDAATGQERWRYNPFPEQPSYTRLWTAGTLGLIGLLSIAWIVHRLSRRRRVSAVLSYATAVAVLLGVGTIALYGAARQFTGRFLHVLLPDPHLEQKHLGPNRGLTYWEVGTDRRIFFAGGHRLVALDAMSGRPVTTFGHHGMVDLTAGLRRPVEQDFYTVTSPGVICRNMLVLGSSVAEGPGRVAPGDVRAFDIHSGQQVWTFHTIPLPGTPGSETWPKATLGRAGGANAWAGMIADEARGLVYVPTGSAAFDYFGGDRLGDNLYSDSLVALRATTGEPVWHYQMVRHDLWDYDLPCPPVLATIRHNGRMVDVVVQPTKQGYVFVLNRDTGESLFPVEQRRVPASNVNAEAAAPTQPIPTKPPSLVRQSVTEDDLTNLSAAAHERALHEFRSLHGASMFLPPSEQGTIVIPGFQGGPNWGGASFDAQHARLLINSNEIPYRLRLKAAKSGSGYPFTVENMDDPFIDSEGYPAIRPPWGVLSAINLEAGTIEWQVPLGEYPELTRRGVAPTGTANIGGSIQTANGISFIAATKDRKIRAIDTSTGSVLWSADLSAAGHATPATYFAGGRQYVVIAAGGGSIAESVPSGDEYIAFSLPKSLN